MSHACILFVLLITVVSSTAQRSQRAFGMDDTTDVIDHTRFDSLWHESMQQGKLVTDGYYCNAYMSYRTALANAYPTAYHPNAQLAFWVNAYYACLWEVMHLRVGYRSTVWDSSFFKRDTFNVAEGVHTLQSLRDTIVGCIRDVRASVFLATGSTHDPPFRANACFAKTVRVAMRDLLRRVCRSEKFVFYDPAGNVLQLSSFFKPLTERMRAEAGSEVQWVLPYVSDQTAALLALHRASVRVVLGDRIEKWKRGRKRDR
ncbi:MAG: hypothetical protein SGJ05_09730 [bacterium]|nr:hypothetical protein [bacterium]